MLFHCAITGTLSLLLGIFVYSRNDHQVNKIWMFLNLSISLWSWGIFGRELSIGKNNCSFFGSIMLCGSIFVPPFFFHFVNSLLKLDKEQVDLGILCISFIFLTFDFTPLLIKDVRPILSFRYYGVPGPIYPFYAVSQFSIISYGHYILIKHFKRCRRANKKSNQILINCSYHRLFGGDDPLFCPVSISRCFHSDFTLFQLTW